MPQDLVQIFKQNEKNMGRRRGDYDSPRVQRDEVSWEERPNGAVVRICNKNHLMNSVFQGGRC
ncbi:MAG: hypothetical protein AAB706_02390 [Patescibacteria group bacterium]